MIIKNVHMIITLFIGMLCSHIQAQNISSEIEKGSQIKLKTIGLYDIPEKVSTSFYGFSQLNVFDGNNSESIWWSKNSDCIQGIYEVDSVNSSYLIFKWNKDQKECDWVGIGFGWDGWSAKDMAYLKDSLAFSITLRSSKREISNLPWAFGMEDYNGHQSWIGFKKDFLSNPTISKTWNTILIPLSSFPILENEVDLTATKQLIIQLFAAGEIELKSIRLVPYKILKDH